MGAAASGLLEVISKDPPVHEKEIGELWDALDSNKNGVLDNTEASQFFFNLYVFATFPPAGHFSSFSGGDRNVSICDEAATRTPIE